MALQLRRTRKIIVKKPLPAPVYGEEEGPRFESEGVTLQATIQPLRGSLEATLYGEESTHMKLMLTNSKVELKEGMGVCLERQDGECDYRIAAPVERWNTHQRATLKRR